MDHCLESLKNKWNPVTGYIIFSDAAHKIKNYITGYDSEVRPHEYNDELPHD